MIILQCFYHALVMAWETFWALVLGFFISGVLQVFVSESAMSRRFGRANLKTIGMATVLGAASSSCSYAAAAAGRSAFKQGAALTVTLAFMFASTNLVAELGAVLWLLLGWRFLAANIVGAFILIGLVWSMTSVFFPRGLEDEARKHANEESDDEGDDCCRHDHDQVETKASQWAQVGRAFVMDWSMLWKEITIGFLLAGFLATLVPSEWWQALFLRSGPAWLRLIENCVVGPLIAVGSFVCSVGNIPLAAHLWSAGISFGGVISFIFADLIILPLIMIYVKYYGARAATRIVAIFFVCMVLTGIAVDLLFGFFGLIPSGPRPPSPVMEMGIRWNYTSWLDLAAVVVMGWLFLMSRRHRAQAP